MAYSGNNDDIGKRDKTDVISSHTLEVKIEDAKRVKAALRQMNGTFIGRKYPLNNGTSIVGRDPGLDITIQDNSVSRRHAELIYDNNTLQIVDLKSTNGTFLNDKPVKNASASHGDLIRFGNILFKVIPPGDIESIFHDELHNLANLDGLTGTYNRKYILNYLEGEIKRCGQLNLPLSLIIFDLDHFKKVNDVHGHLAGDYVLKETVRLMKEKVLRASDTLGRYGGEEFCVILSESAVKTATDVAERLRAAVATHHFSFNDKKIPVTISAGVAQMSSETSSSSELIDEADKLLYKAKEGGRNRVCR
ncbi:MAG: GGDEF domain-containing protein [Oligoflexia bacterium]|nr:GGDEF domain-containing protein [Oligoflexia bacterium]